MRPAAFLDRDGVLNEDRGYLHRPEDFVILPGVEAALARLQRLGYALVVVTNQSGIGRGYYDEAALATLHDILRARLAAAGVTLTAIYHCPHIPADDCDCRKPAPGMIHRAVAEHDLDPAASILVGDKAADLQAGRAAGVGRCFLVRSSPHYSRAADPLADAVFDDLAACVAALGDQPASRTSAGTGSTQDG